MKILLFGFGLLLLGLKSYATSIIVQSELIPTCYERSNTALVAAVNSAEQKAMHRCSNPVLLQLKTEIKPGNCGFVRVLAKYECQ